MIMHVQRFTWKYKAWIQERWIGQKIKGFELWLKMRRDIQGKSVMSRIPLMMTKIQG
jgi:hypothetical protein